MAGEFRFPPYIHFDDMKWRLIYAPDDPNTVAPNLTDSQQLSMTCDPVTIPGRSTPIYLVIIDILFPSHRNSAGNFIPERRLKAFRTYSHPPYSPQDVRPQECVYYMAEGGGRGSAAQRFFDAITGQAQAQAQLEAQADASWCKDLAIEVKNEPGVVSENQQERGPSDTPVSQS